MHSTLPTHTRSNKFNFAKPPSYPNFGELYPKDVYYLNMNPVCIAQPTTGDIIASLHDRSCKTDYLRETEKLELPLFSAKGTIYWYGFGTRDNNNVFGIEAHAAQQQLGLLGKVVLGNSYREF
uniref:Peptidase S1 domain-containing protein n=1 Tax=Rhabditophanes sp. KR3021 TaxID=114890 RepID=A0AC35TSP1_9BILA